METDRGTRGWWASGLKGRWKGEWQGVQGSWRDGKRRRLPSSLKAICSGPSCHYEFLLTLAKMMQNPTPRRTQVIFFFYSQPDSILIKSQFTPAIPNTEVSVNPKTPGVHTPALRKHFKYTHTEPRGTSSLYLLISRPEGSAVSSYIDIFLRRQKN